MQNATHKINSYHGQAKKALAYLKPAKKANKSFIRYVYKKPYHSIGIATLVSGMLIGIAYANIKYFLK